MTISTTSQITTIFLPIEEIRAICERYNVAKLSLFGSVLRSDFRPDSDIDVLVEFEGEHTPGLRFITMQDELSRILNRRVDLNTPGFLSRHFRHKVVESAVTIYERT